MKIKFLRSVAVKAIHREAGTVHELADADALALIRMGAALPAPEEVETATAKPATENAARTRKPRK